MHRTAIFGPPGTGKTTKLLHIIEAELDRGVKPEEIAFVSFTNAAVDEARQRVVNRFSLTKKDIPWFRTIHSLCFALTKQHGARVVTGGDLKIFAQLNRIADFSGNPRKKERGDIALEAYHLARSAGLPLKDAWMRCTNWMIHDFGVIYDFIQAYEDWKLQVNRVDFQDMIDDYLESPVTPPIKVSIIDEAQDLNAQQWQVIRETFSESERQYIAGDDDQSIYAWSGSRMDMMLTYPADEKIVLKQSHRCPKAVHNLAKVILSRIKQREPKDWLPRPEDGLWKMFGDYAYVPFGKYPEESWFVLARSDFMLDDIRWWLQSIGEVYLDEKGYSVNQRIAQKIQTIVELQKGKRVPVESLRRAVWDSSLEYSVIDLVHLPTKGFVNAEEAGIDVKKVNPVSIFSRLIADDDIVDYYVRALAVHGDLTKRPMMELSTIHKAKGREADNVVVLMDQTGTIIDSAAMDPDNEHRNWYVAMTRARKRLFTVLGRSVHNYEL